MKKLAIFLPLTLSILAAGCAQNDVSETESAKALVIPEWVKAPSKAEDANYFYAKGEAPLTENVAESKKLSKTNAKEGLRNQVIANLKKHYASKAAQMNEDKGGLELRIRQEARKNIRAYNIDMPVVDKVFINPDEQKITSLAKLDKDKMEQQMRDRLVMLDNQLRDYIHVSMKGSNLRQMLSIMPALPTLEERSMIKSNLEALKGKSITLPNDALADMLDKQLTKLMDNLVISLDASTDETAAYEQRLVNALTEEGFNMSARKPDLTFKYFVETEQSIEENMNKVVLVGDVEMINDRGDTFATTGNAYQGMNKYQKEAEKEAVAAMASDVTNTIVKSAIDFMNKVNRENHGR